MSAMQRKFVVCLFLREKSILSNPNAKRRSEHATVVVPVL
jgi:hypothetical protein